MATDANVAPIPYNTPLTDRNGLVTIAWQNWLRQMFKRVGGNTAQLLEPVDLKTSSVTSVAMTVPNILNVAGSPITTTGTLALTLATQLANLFWAGPASGAAAAPTFRTLVAADIPAMNGAVTPLTLPSSITLTSGNVTSWPGLTIPSGLTMTVVGGSVLQGTRYITIASGGTLTVNSGGTVYID